uniref:Uncharacterized protein n=1 Tax=Arundo donax TaxID=35708 RepID=A0A0A9BLE5_ARUDO
MWFPLNHSGQ